MIALFAAVPPSPDAIAAGTGEASGSYCAGANDVALTLAGLRDAPNASLGVSVGEHFGTLVSDVGFSARSSLDSVEVHRTLSEHADV